MLVICDFDGTITYKDVTVAMLDHFAGPVWREGIPAYRAGKLSHFEHMQNLYAYLKVPANELLAYARRETQLRPHFARLTRFCREQKWPFAVVSGGVDFYLKDFLGEEVPFHCYLGDYNEYWKLELPEWPKIDIKAGQDFKVRIIEELQLKHPGLPTVFIGDGFNDWAAASHADYVFTVADSMLSKICNEKGKSHTDFNDFAEVINALKQLSQE
jgi:2-hydroxy-3-keto-5-methylthiopentenyl-1-phosphate phosphatase